MLVWGWWAVAAWAGSGNSPIAGDLAFSYGRNLGQGLNVANLVVEVKVEVHPQVAVGARLAGAIGVSVADDGAKAYLGAPLLLKAEGFLNDHPSRPFVGLGLGVTPTAAAGVLLQTDAANLEGTAWAVAGPIPTLMPELGVDLRGFRAAVQYNWMVGSAREAAASIDAGTGGAAVSVDDGVPGLDGVMVQIGFHFGGPKAGSATTPPGSAPP